MGDVASLIAALAGVRSGMGEPERGYVSVAELAQRTERWISPLNAICTSKPTSRSRLIRKGLPSIGASSPIWPVNFAASVRYKLASDLFSRVNSTVASCVP